MTTIEFREDVLWVDGDECEAGSDGAFEVLASQLKTARLSDCPEDVRIRLCDRVVGDNDYMPRSFSFERISDDEYCVSGETAFFDAEDELDQESLSSYLQESIGHAVAVLGRLKEGGHSIEWEESVYDEIAYLNFSIVVTDQLIIDAELFVEEIVSRLHGYGEERRIFISYASEDDNFVKKLVDVLDKRALHAWYDKREVFVGDSIVAKINEGLADADIVVVVLSSTSVTKPWLNREMNAILIRQITAGDVKIFPVLIEPCAIPPLMRDVRYADFSESFDEGMKELLAAIRHHRSTAG